jgi:ATP-dependent exoDNAse (exonuclease V) beta subunit
MSERAIPDAAERHRALDPDRSFIVQAPAGSGKTELLIQRFLVLLARVERPEEIVAITFTRKAAAEMRARVIAALALARHAHAPEAEHMRRTWELGRRVLERNDALGWKLEESATRLRVQTIDALCASLTRQMPVLSRFGAQPEPIDDATLLFLEAARETLALVEEDGELADAVARLLSHLDNHVQRAERLIAGLLARRDHWLRLLRQGNDRQALEAVLADICRIGTERARGLFPPGYALPQPGDMRAWIALVDTYVTTSDGTWRKKKGVVPAELIANGELLESLCALRKLPSAEYSNEQWQALEAILKVLKVALAQLKIVFAAHGQADFTEISQAALHALGTPEEPTDLLLALDYRIGHLLVDEFQDTSFTQFELLRKLTSGWTEGDGRTLFVVGDPMQSIYRFREAEVGLFLRARRDGVGSVALEPLTLSANFRSRGGIVEWVNRTFRRVLPQQEDAMRGAVPYTPSVAVHGGDAAAEVKIHPFFDADAVAEAEAVVRLARAALEEPPGADGTASTVAILVRNRAHLTEILPRLRAAGLRFRAIEIESLANRPAVQDLLSLTRALAHPADRTAWLAVLRAPWCGLSLEDLWQLAGIDREPAPEGPRRALALVRDALADAVTRARLSAGGARRAQRVAAVLAAGHARRRRSSLRDAVERAWLALGGPACLEGASDAQDVEAYLSHLALAEEAGALGDLARFEVSLERLFAAPDAQASERLQVMTIHKAKGLEFDTVIVPQLGAAARADERKLLVWMERPSAEGAGEFEFLLSPLNRAGSDDDKIYQYIRTLDREKDALQDGRLLYVAATRPKRAQHWLGDVKRERNGEAIELQPRRDALLERLWPEVRDEFSAAAHAAREDGATYSTAHRDSLFRLRETCFDVMAPPGVAWTASAELEAVREEIEFSWAGETARHTGSVVHRWLQAIAHEGLERWDAKRVEALRPGVRRALAARGVNEADLERATSRVLQALCACLDEPRARWILGPHPETWNEHRLTVAASGVARAIAIDRMFRDEAGQRWIVDYKTSAHEGSDVERFLDRERDRYRVQLEGYRAAFPGESVRLGLYFPLMKGWREI